MRVAELYFEKKNSKNKAILSLAWNFYVLKFFLLCYFYVSLQDFQNKPQPDTGHRLLQAFPPVAWRKIS